MPAGSEIETQLARAMQDVGGEDSQVLGDMLVEKGDARGELISAECRLLQGDDDPRWRELIELHYLLNARTWLGTQITQHIGEPFKITANGSVDNGWVGHVKGSRMQCGLVHGFLRSVIFENVVDRDARSLREVLTTDRSRYISQLAVGCGPFELKEVVGLLTVIELPRIERLSLRCSTEGKSPRIEWELSEAFWASFAELKNLCLFGVVFATPPPPSIQCLDVGPYNALPAYSRLPELKTLELTFACREEIAIPIERVAESFSPLVAPALELLDLNGNEPGYNGSNNSGGDISAYDFLQHLRHHPKLKRLILPSARTREDVDKLRVALDSNPGWQRVEVARLYGDVQGLDSLVAEDPRLHVAPRYPWPAKDTLQADPELWLMFHDDDKGYAVTLIHLIHVLERRWDDEEQRGVWEELFACLGTLPEDDYGELVEIEFSVARLAAAFEALDHPWAANFGTIFREHAECCAGDTLRVARHWGW